VTFNARADHQMGSYIRGPSYLAWSDGDELTGVALWGRLEPRHAARLLRALDATSGKNAHLFLIDARRVESMDPAALDVFARYVRSRAETLRQHILAQALLRPLGPVGIVVASFYKLLEHRYPFEVFTDPCEALSWLGASNRTGMIAATEHLLNGVPCTARIVQALRAQLSLCPGTGKLGRVSAALGLSPRTLQRKLLEANTSFQLERSHVQVDRAKQLLCDTNHTIKRVAYEVGCSSAAAFCVLFRRVEGQSPSAWRKRQGVSGNLPTQ